MVVGLEFGEWKDIFMVKFLYKVILRENDIYDIVKCRECNENREGMFSCFVVYIVEE